MLQLILDLARFSLVTGLISLAGVGVTACLRAPFDSTTRLLMGPAFGQALWAIALGSGVAMGLPVSAFAHGLWGATLLLAAAGVWQLRTNRSVPSNSEVSQRAPLIHACVWLLPVLVMGPYFWHRLSEYPGSGLPDGWAYAAYGQYLWDVANGTEGGLAPLYQYASTLSSTRTIASAQLGVLALLNHPGDVQAGFGLLQAAGLAAYGSAAAAFCRRGDRGLAATVITVVVTVMSGWVLDVVWANNLDNLLALAYAPALAVMALWPRPDAAGWWLGGAWLAAGVLHTYPEMGVAVLACAVLSSGTILASRRGVRRRWLAPAVGAAVLLVVLMPSIGGLATLLERQGHAASAIGEPRPGEGMFVGLVTPRHVLAGWWALGSEHAYERVLVPRTVVAAALSVLLVAGVHRTLREKRTAWLIWLALPIGLAPFLALVQGYGYGAYKAILMGWWFQVFLVVHGATALTSSRRRVSLAMTVWLVVAALPGAAAARLLFAPVSRSFRMPRPASMAVFRQVRDVSVLVGSSPVLIAVQDEEASEWAVYYLRQLTTTVLTRDRYMRPKEAAMERSAPVDRQTVRWVLADAASAFPAGVGTDWTRRWSGGPYALWETPPGGGRALEPAFAAAQ